MSASGFAQERIGTLRGALDAWNDRAFDQVAARTTEDCEWLDVASGTSFRGRDGFRQYIEAWLAAMPDNQVEIINEIVSGDWEVIEAIGRATHTGSMMTAAGELPPTGRKLDLRFCMVGHIRDGQIDRCSVYVDIGPMR